MPSRRLTFLITSGPTKEYLDPVRFISNDSSGKMGATLADLAAKKHDVIFITGPISVKPSKKVKAINVTSAAEMFNAVKRNFKTADIVIGAAAVADFTPAVLRKNKIKKGGLATRVIKLRKNPDIIAYCGKNKKNQIVVSFALETENILKNAASKLKEKKADFIVANSKDSISSDKTSAQIIFKDGSKISVKNADKKILAGKIIDESIGLFKNLKACQKNS